jgi:exodeoxyribonuclease VII large subunit
MNTFQAVDCIILARGGGSIEDLWAFNDERVVRAIAASQIPIVSAIGHETDFTLADFVSDLRAPTPSAAAEMVVADTFETARYYDELVKRFSFQFQSYLSDKYRLYREIISDTSLRLPLRLLSESRQRLDQLNEKKILIASLFFNKIRTRLSQTASQLDALSPLNVLARGYSVVTSLEGQTITTASTLSPGKRVSIRFHRGEAQADITAVLPHHII